MAVITAAMVKELRVKTDAPMMECKKALTEADGNMEQAEEILRVKLGNKATKAASRITADGVVAIYIDEPGKIGAIVELNSETDFVLRMPTSSLSPTISPSSSPKTNRLTLLLFLLFRSTALPLTKFVKA